MTMGTWKTKKIGKRTKGSQTPGRLKGLVPPTWARACAKMSRAYRNNPWYTLWNEKCDGSKVKWTKA